MRDCVPKDGDQADDAERSCEGRVHGERAFRKRENRCRESGVSESPGVLGTFFRFSSTAGCLTRRYQVFFCRNQVLSFMEF